MTVDEQWLTHPVFRQLSPEALTMLRLQGSVRTYAAGEHVFHEGEERPPALYILLSGSMHVSKVAASGKETIIRIVRPGEIFGSVVLFGKPAMPATATIDEAATVFSLPRSAFLDLIRQDPEWAMYLMHTLADRMRELQDRLHGVASERAPSRLAGILRHQAQRDGVWPQGSLTTPLSYAMLAQMGGITYEETVRIVRGWVRAGWLAYRRGGHVDVLDGVALAQVADNGGL
jgi:CRP-like cAMP-binding protein